MSDASATIDQETLITYPQRRSGTRRSQEQPWAISSVIIANAATRMRILDPEATGRILKCTFVKFYGNLFTSTDLLKIWKLVDILKKGTISEEDYAVALFLLHRTRVGLPLPISLPLALVPPSIRNHPLFQSSYDEDIDGIWDPKAGAPVTWDICESIRSHAAKMFSAIDVNSVGYVEQDSVSALMKRFNLGARDSRRICKLLGLGDPCKSLKKNGVNRVPKIFSELRMQTPEGVASVMRLVKSPSSRITLHLYTVALFLIHWTLAGQDLPQNLPDVLRTSSTLPVSSSTIPDHSRPSESDLPPLVQNYRKSLQNLASENKRLREQRLILQNHETSVPPLPALKVSARPVRPLPVPVSGSAPLLVAVQASARSLQLEALERSDRTGEVTTVPTSMSIPLAGVNVQVSALSSQSEASQLPLESSESDGESTTAPPLNALRNEVEQLRGMIERLMEENVALKSSVQEMQRQRNRMGQEVEISEFTDTVQVGDFPPPYEERIFC